MKNKVKKKKIRTASKPKNTARFEKKGGRRRSKLPKKSHAPVTDCMKSETVTNVAQIDNHLTADKLNSQSVVSAFCWEAAAPPDFRPFADPAGDSESDGDDNNCGPEQVGAGAAERPATRTSRELQLFELERQRAANGLQLVTSDDHERLVLAQPDDSAAWIRYMAHFLQSAEVDKARAIARRALNTIGHRHDAEKLNVYVAWLNLETLHGNEQTLAAVQTEAESACDSERVCTRMAQVYAAAGQWERAEQMHVRMARRHAHLPDTWLQYAVFLMTAGGGGEEGGGDRAADARALLPRALRVLDRRHHVSVISKFGQLEFRHGDAERGRTVFDQLLAAHPRRLDQWLVYVAQLRRIGDVDGVRRVFERLTGSGVSSAPVTLDVRRARSVYKQWLEFEVQYGGEKQQARVRQLAMKYVDQQCA